MKKLGATVIEIIVALLVCFSLAMCLSFYFPACYPNEATDVVKTHDKQVMTRQTGRSISNYYLVFTDKEVFMIEDSLSRFMFHSSDLFNEIKTGQCYTFTVYGYRDHLLSQYRRILEVRPTKCKE